MVKSERIPTPPIRHRGNRRNRQNNKKRFCQKCSFCGETGLACGLPFSGGQLRYGFISNSLVRTNQKKRKSDGIRLGSELLTNYDDFLIKRFEQPDEVRTFEKGKFETVKIGSMTIGRASYEPGWKWSAHVGAATGASFCEVEHVGIVLSGCAACQMKDGRYYEMRAGDLFYIGPGHDSWVVGDEPYVSLHFLGAEHYARH
jgi:mannose-6-phosphate isomerase-like protein (cupin superfamily)